jgi:hypothetical protein
MGLVPCPECDNRVSEAARACPRCGHPLREGALRAAWNHVLRHALLVALALPMILIVHSVVRHGQFPSLFSLFFLPQFGFLWSVLGMIAIAWIWGRRAGATTFDWRHSTKVAWSGVGLYTALLIFRVPR